MAKVIFGPLVQSVRGAIAGCVFRGGRSGSSVSGAPSVIRSRSVGQERARSIVSIAARKWASLSFKEKQSWAIYATPSVRPGETFTPSASLGRAAFFRWYTAVLWCGQTPSYFWPRSPVFDFAAVAMLYNKRTPPAVQAIVTTNTTAVPTAALWVAPRLNQYTVPSRACWSLVTAPFIGDAQVWQLAPAYYPGGYGLDVGAWLSARVPNWSTSGEWVYRLRICIGSSLVQPVDIGLWDSGVIYP